MFVAVLSESAIIKTAMSRKVGASPGARSFRIPEPPHQTESSSGSTNRASRSKDPSSTLRKSSTRIATLIAEPVA